MYQFDSYIDSILSGLNMNKKQKIEMAEEFNDHLERLKQEYIEKGINEDEAVIKAMESFGDGKALNKGLNCSLLNYRTKPNILFGICYIFFSIFFYKIVILSNISYNVDMTSLEYIKSQGIMIILDIIMFSPMGYFLPIIFTKLRKLSHIASINIMIITFTLYLYVFIVRLKLGVPYNVSFYEDVVAMIPMIIIGLFSTMLGYKVLDIVSGKTSKLNKLVS